MCELIVNLKRDEIFIEFGRSKSNLGPLGFIHWLFQLVWLNVISFEESRFFFSFFDGETLKFGNFHYRLNEWINDFIIHNHFIHNYLWLYVTCFVVSWYCFLKPETWHWKKSSMWLASMGPQIQRVTRDAIQPLTHRQNPSLVSVEPPTLSLSLSAAPCWKMGPF